MEDGRRRGKTERNSKRAGRKTKKKESCQKVVINFFEKGWKMEEAEENQKGKAEEEKTLANPSDKHPKPKLEKSET
jgi:hypothetical protein